MSIRFRQLMDSLLSVFSKLNWLDYIIIAVFLFYLFEGFQAGFVNSLFDLFSFIFSFSFALRFYSLIGDFFTANFFMSKGFANALGFFIIAIFIEVLISVFIKKLFKAGNDSVIQKQNLLTNPKIEKIDRIFGIIPAFFSAFILLSFLLTVIIAFPLSPYVKKIITDSQIGNILVSKTQGFEKTLSSVFGGAVYDTLNFLTIEPQSSQLVSLKFTVKNPVIDEQAEKTMLFLVNKERESRGFSPLDLDNALVHLARAHGEDMFKRGYFSHNTPEGLTPFDRMAESDISYGFAGENLAISPNTELALNGLMQSPGHKANILSNDFKKIGIGVLDGGIYGQMFVQEFTD